MRKSISSVIFYGCQDWTVARMLREDWRQVALGGLGLALVLFTPLGLSAEEKAGRYTMSPAEGGGFARLDTESGQMSLCQRREGDWSCRDMVDPGRGLDAEIDRLRDENRRLKAELRQKEEMVPGGPGQSGSGSGFKLPTEKEVDAAMDYAQRMLRKFRDRLKDLEGELPEKKGTPL